jgi:fumarylacetoacetase
MFRQDDPLPLNYKWAPLGYHGRASSIVPSGTPVRRPSGQLLAGGSHSPVFAPSRQLDYEGEIGIFVGAGNSLGSPIPIAEAEDHILGLCLLNDWSARDIQWWESQPLGPFLSKSFATTISPWVVTLDALEPFRVPRFQRSEADPAPLPYLDCERNRERGGIAITVEVWLATAQMRAQSVRPVRLSCAGFEHMYWTVAQLLTHHASNGCNLRPGDLLGSGTVSGPEGHARGCLLERTWRGAAPVTLPTGESRTFLEDGDEVILRAYAERPGAHRIGFGECRGTLVP